MVSCLGTIPFLNCLLSVSVNSCCLIMTREMDIVVVSNSSVTMRLTDILTRSMPFICELPFRKDVNTKNFILFVRVTIFTWHAFRAKFFLYLFKHIFKLVLLVLFLHFRHSKSLGLFGFFLPFLVSLFNVTFNEIPYLLISYFIGEYLHH